jgi:DNA recombination protein RmuC
MFLPGEAIFAAALEEAPGCWRRGRGAGCCMATPTTLDRAAADRALRLAAGEAGRERREDQRAGAAAARAGGDAGRALVAAGAALGKATEHFNAAAASFEGRVLPAARRLEELGRRSKKSIDELPRLDCGRAPVVARRARDPCRLVE